MAFKNQVESKTLRNPVCIVLAMGTTEEIAAKVDAVRSQLDAAGILFAAMCHDPEVGVYIEPQDLDRAELAGVQLETRPDKITVKDGKVIEFERWVRWNGVLWRNIDIKREENRFRSDIGDPEHGGGTMIGKFEEVVWGLHPCFQAQYHQLFHLEKPTEIMIREIGFMDEYIEFQ